MEMSFDGNVILVTGGAAGVGAGIVRNLLTESACHVAFLDIAEREGSALESELIIKFGPLKAKFIKCDISDEKQLTEAYRQVIDKYRRLDVVVNNAGVLNNEDCFRKMIDTNFKGTVSSTYKALEAMGVDKDGNGGVIVNVSSLRALSPSPQLPVYAATKSAVLAFTISLGTKELYEKTNVRVMTVCLGPTDTALLHRCNLQNFDKDCTYCITSCAEVRQSVESAVTGILKVIDKGQTGTTWIIADDKPPVNITENVQKGFEHFSTHSY